MTALLLVASMGCSTVTPIEDLVIPRRLGAHGFPHPGEIPGIQKRIPETPVALIETGLEHLDPARPQGQDYSSAAAFFLRAAEVADPIEEQDLALASYRAAARAALRSGNRVAYARAVEGWSSVTMLHEQQVGELALHRAIHARLRGEAAHLNVRVPTHINNLITSE